MRNARNRLAALGAAVVMVACSPAASRHVSSAPGTSDITLTVTNQNWLDVAVYIVQGGGRFRLGDVVGNTTRRLRIPTNLITGWTVQLIADPIGSDEVYITDVIPVAPDERVQLMVAPRMRMSSYAVSSR